jgi:hypothetical protein
MKKSLLLNPFFIFWAYYFIGPFITLPQILNIATTESLFHERFIIAKLGFHSLAYLAIFPFILYISKYLKLNNSYKLQPELLGGVRPVLIIFIFIFIFFLLYFLYSNSILLLGGDYIRAVAYINYLEQYHIVTLLVLMLIIIYIFLDGKYFLILGIFIVIFDALMSRRSLMIFFFYPFMRKISYKHLVFIFIFFSLFSIFRHRTAILFEFSSLYAPFFSESYMVFLSSVQFNGCPVSVSPLYNYLDFERIYQDCRQVSSGAGGFSSRFYYNIYFGLLSVGSFTVLNVTVLYSFAKYINSRLHTLLDIIIFVTLFIIFRDSLWNAQLFFLRYFAVLLSASLLISMLKKMSIFSEKQSKTIISPNINK